MIGTGCNPNVAAVIVIGIEPKWTKELLMELQNWKASRGLILNVLETLYYNESI